MTSGTILAQFIASASYLFGLIGPPCSTSIPNGLVTGLFSLFHKRHNVLCRFLVPFIQGRLVLDFLSPSSKTNLYWIPCSHDPRQICTGFLVTITKGGLVQLYQILHSHNSRHSCTGLHVTIFQGRLVLDSMFPSSETNLCWISPSLYLRQLY